MDVKKLVNSFFKWYEKHYVLNITIALGLFLLQIVHLCWLASDVIAYKLWGLKFFPVSDFWQNVLILVDYTEIPALVGTALIYVNELRKKYSLKNVIFITLLLSQVLHIFWITDEFVVESFTGAVRQSLLPGWLAWIAILIDYGEVPVIIDTAKKLAVALKQRNIKFVSAAFKEK